MERERGYKRDRNAMGKRKEIKGMERKGKNIKKMES